jgi:hypothetical protein
MLAFAGQGPQDKGISEEANARLPPTSMINGRFVSAGCNGMYGGDGPLPKGSWCFVKNRSAASIAGQDLKLSLGAIDDYDETYFNGVRVGGYGRETPQSYAVQREYTIPANLIKPGKNVIAVRVWDVYGGGGLTSSDAKILQLKSPKVTAKLADMYHPDYRDDFDLGDEPYRYYNW